MPLSLHSHSGQFCKHAANDLEEMVQRAIELGFEIYGLSEHVPRQRDQDLYDEEVEAGVTPDMLEQTFADYVAHARALQDKYADRIALVVGCETENIHEKSLERVRELSAVHRPDYIVGSVHHVGGVPIDFSEALFERALASVGGDLQALFGAYYDLQYDMLRALKPAVVGHFDLIRLYRPTATYEPAVLAKIDRNIALAVANGALFEVNSSALRKGLHAPYPLPDTLTRIIAANGRFTLSDDSHRVPHVAVRYLDLRDYLVAHGITRVHGLRRTADGDVVTVAYDDIAAHPFWRRLAGQL